MARAQNLPLLLYWPLYINFNFIRLLLWGRAYYLANCNYWIQRFVSVLKLNSFKIKLSDVKIIELKEVLLKQHFGLH